MSGEGQDELAARDRAAKSDDAAADAHDQQALSDDAAATARDRDADARDDFAAERHRAAANPTVPDPPASLLRRQAAEDREDAAQDRASAVEERARSRRNRKASGQDRERAARDRAAASEAFTNLKMLLAHAEDNAEGMLLIQEVQGMLMATRDHGALEALLEVCTRADRDQTELDDAARSIAADLETGDPPA
jgi:hypothetical protein